MRKISCGIVLTKTARTRLAALFISLAAAIALWLAAAPESRADSDPRACADACYSYCNHGSGRIRWVFERCYKNCYSDCIICGRCAFSFLELKKDGPDKNAVAACSEDDAKTEGTSGETPRAKTPAAKADARAI